MKHGFMLLRDAQQFHSGEIEQKQTILTVLCLKDNYYYLQIFFSFRSLNCCINAISHSQSSRYSGKWHFCLLILNFWHILIGYITVLSIMFITKQLQAVEDSIQFWAGVHSVHLSIHPFPP